MSFDSLELRRKLVKLDLPGATVDALGTFELISAAARKFGRGRGIPLQIDPIEGGARITRLAEKQKGTHAYPEIAQLPPGQSVLLDVPPLSHQRVRVTASQTATRLGRTYRCMREGDAMRVIRTDGIPADAIAVPTRATKYDLDRLATGERLTFEIAPADHHKLRAACTFKGKQTGWTIRCRLQDDGTMLVYRTDAGAVSTA